MRKYSKKKGGASFGNPFSSAAATITYPIRKIRNLLSSMPPRRSRPSSPSNRASQVHVPSPSVNDLPLQDQSPHENPFREKDYRNTPRTIRIRSEKTMNFIELIMRGYNFIFIDESGFNEHVA